MSIEKLPSGNYRARVRTHAVKLAKVFPTRGEAREWEAQIKTNHYEISAGFPVSGKTLADLLIRFREEIIPQRYRAPNSVRRNLNCVLRDPIALIALVDLLPSDVVEFRERMLQSLSNGTVEARLCLLRKALNIAKNEWQWIVINPCAHVATPKPPAPRQRRISSEELAMIACAADYYILTPVKTPAQQMVAALFLAVETAMRRGEIFGLKWCHVMLQEKFAHLPLTKNGDSRNVALSDSAVKILLGLRGLHPEKVFTIQGGTAHAYFSQITKALELNDIRFHDSRREGVTRLAGKLKLLDLSKQTGHKKARVLNRAYYQPTLEELMAKINPPAEEAITKDSEGSR